MGDIEATIRALSEVDAVLEKAIGSLAADPTLHKAKAEAEFQGTKGAWRRVGGLTLFLREGDGVIMNGPLALRGQPMSNITGDDFRAISKVKEIYQRQGKDAVPGEDVTEVASGVSKTTLTADHAKVIITRGFDSVTADVQALVSKGRYEKVESKSFSGKDELSSFEAAKAWARKRLRAKGRNKVKPSG